jgi:hypothetical protein
MSNARSVPKYTIKVKTEIPNVAGFSKHFQAKDSPGPVYNPVEIDNKVRFKHFKYSVGKSPRFFEESHIKRLKALPPSYQEEILTQAHKYQKVSIGYGKKQGIKVSIENTPGPGLYENHQI